jgi:hypothetical protein
MVLDTSYIETSFLRHTVSYFETEGTNEIRCAIIGINPPTASGTGKTSVPRPKSDLVDVKTLLNFYGFLL